MQEVVDGTLLEKVETSIKSNKSLQMLYIRIEHSGMVEAVLKGARGNTTLKELTIVSYGKQHQDTAAAELQQIRPKLGIAYIY